jgi:hypothetical protein
MCVLALAAVLVGCTENITEVTEVQGGGNRVVVNGEDEAHVDDVLYTGADTVVVYNADNADINQLIDALNQIEATQLTLYGIGNNIQMLRGMMTIERYIVDGLFIPRFVDAPSLRYVRCHTIDSLHNGVADTVIATGYNHIGDTSGMYYVETDSMVTP